MQPSAANAKTRRILIVDDNEDAADLIAEGLRRFGHAARAAFDGPSALILASEFRPQLALLDLGLPGMDGYELARRLRADLADGALVLMALTGYGLEGDRERTRAAGFACHWVKPVDLAKLHREICELLPESD